MLGNITAQTIANNGITAIFLIDRASSSRKIHITYNTNKYTYHRKLPTQKVMQFYEPPVECDGSRNQKEGLRYEPKTVKHILTD